MDNLIDLDSDKGEQPGPSNVAAVNLPEFYCGEDIGRSMYRISPINKPAKAIGRTHTKRKKYDVLYLHKRLTSHSLANKYAIAMQLSPSW